jgi:hypothetical protein
VLGVLLGMLARLDVRGCIATGRGFVPYWRNPRGRPALGLPAGLLTDLVNGSSRLVRCYGGCLRFDTFSVGPGLDESI